MELTKYSGIRQKKRQGGGTNGTLILATGEQDIFSLQPL